MTTVAAGMRILLRTVPVLRSGCERHTRQAWRVHASFLGSEAQAAARSDKVPVPLCRRQPESVDDVQSLLEWRGEVLRRICELGDSFETADGGPGRSLLEREVAWALDDAVTAYRESPGAAWVPCSWQQLELEVSAAEARRRRQAGVFPGGIGGGGEGAGAERGGMPSAWQVQLRAPVAELRELWRRRLEERVPIQYLLHSAHWREHVLAVGPGVLVPRPETEAMVDLVAAALNADPRLADAPWADLGTGSGALAIGLAGLLAVRRRRGQRAPRAAAESGLESEPAVWAVELSPAAVAYAEANAAACAPPGTVRVVRGSWWGPLVHLRGRLGGVLSNPPYIPRQEMAGLQAEVGRHEPHGALDGGPGPGLDSLEAICAGAGDMLVGGGFIALETAGDEQAAQVARLLHASGAFESAEVVADCYGVGRFVQARRRRK